MWTGKGWSHTNRVAYIVTYGPIPDGMFVCHRCDNPPCCRPDHLFLGTQRENLADMKRKGRSATGDRNGARTHPERFTYDRRAYWRHHPAARAIGERSPTSKLTWVLVRAMRTRYAGGGVTLKQLGSEFGVSTKQAHRVVRGENWPLDEQGVG
jgi:hypothetical protein